MRTSVLFMLAIILLSVSCNEKTNKANKEASYIVTGKFGDNKYDGKTIYLQETLPDSRDHSSIDSVKIVNGQFVFEGTVNDTMPSIRFLELDSSQLALFILEPGKIELVIDSALTVKTNGTILNDLYQQYTTDMKNNIENGRANNEAFEKMKADGKLSREGFDEYIKKQKELDTQYQEATYNFIKPNINNPVGKYFLLDLSYSLSVERLRELLSMTDAGFKNWKRVQKLEKRLQAQEASAVGKPFIDIKGRNLDDKEVSLSDYAGKGKYILVDFWASWCGPCIKIMPEMLASYQKYKGKGFEIVGVSLDGDKEAWEKASKKFNVAWPQLSNLKGWEDEAAMVYGINYIPQTILIDKDGKIIEKGLHGEALNFKLEELLGGQ